MTTDDIIATINNAWVSRYGGEPTTRINELINRVNMIAEERDQLAQLAKKIEIDRKRLTTILFFK